ncbi:hypothetical protein WG66_001603, partial [Moniliophthora roreri]
SLLPPLYTISAFNLKVSLYCFAKVLTRPLKIRLQVPRSLERRCRIHHHHEHPCGSSQCYHYRC